MAQIKGTLFACLGAALIALSAAGFKAREPGACAMPDDNTLAARFLLIF